MRTTRNGKESDNSVTRVVGIVLVVAILGLLMPLGYSFLSRSGFGMMGWQSGGYTSNDVCRPPANLVGQSVSVAVSDMGMMMGAGRRMSLLANPSTLISGRVNIVLSNYGIRTHEVVVLPLASGEVAGARSVGSDGKVDESGSLGEVSNNCGAGIGKGIHSGSFGWATLNLAPGRYELICNLPNHYAAGMYQEIVVTA